MEFTMFLDEYGNTGEQRISKGKWNWGQDPYFALGAIWMDSNASGSLYNELTDLLKSFDPELGVSKEWKSTPLLLVCPSNVSAKLSVVFNI